jgi:hypothetical protein
LSILRPLFLRSIQKEAACDEAFSRYPNSVTNGHDRIRVLILSAQAPTPPNPVGEWNLKTDARGQNHKLHSDDYQGSEAFKGKVASEQYGAQELTDLKYENGTLTYTRNLKSGAGGRDGI